MIGAKRRAYNALHQIAPMTGARLSPWGRIRLWQIIPLESPGFINEDLGHTIKKGGDEAPPLQNTCDFLY